MPSLIFVLGVVGNLFGLLLLERKQMKQKGGPIIIYRILFIIDTIYLLDVIRLNFDFYDLKLLSLSKDWCKSYIYLHNVISSIPPMLLVYISIERFVSIRNPHKIDMFRKRSFQFTYFFQIVLFSLILYMPIIYSFELPIDDKLCKFNKSTGLFLMRSISLVLLILATCVLLIQMLSKAIKDNLSSLILNLVYLALNLPFFIVYFNFNNSEYDKVAYQMIVAVNLYLTSFASKFYLILISNRLFRQEFYLMFTEKRTKTMKFKFINVRFNFHVENRAILQRMV